MIRKPDLRALIEANRAVHAPSQEDRERNRGGLVGRIGAGVVLGAGVFGARAAAADVLAGLPSSIGASTLAVSGWAKWLALAALVAAGGMGAGVFLLVARHAAAARAAVVSSSIPVAASPAASPMADDPSPSIPAPSVSAAASPVTPASSGGPIQDEGARGQARIPTPSSAAPSGHVAAEGLGRELDLLRSARRAIDDGTPEAALKILDRYEAEFPHGARLETESDATRVIALCATGRTAAAEQAKNKFLETHRGSPLADRVRTTCGVH